MVMVPFIETIPRALVWRIRWIDRFSKIWLCLHRKHYSRYHYCTHNQFISPSRNCWKSLGSSHWKIRDSFSTSKVYYRYFVYISFFTCILWIYTEANEVVGLLTALGFIWKIESAIMGLTFLAWANSVGDLVSDISLAKAGKARTAVAACFGTPLLNLLGPFQTNY